MLSSFSPSAPKNHPILSADAKFSRKRTFSCLSPPLSGVTRKPLPLLAPEYKCSVMCIKPQNSILNPSALEALKRAFQKGRKVGPLAPPIDLEVKDEKMENKEELVHTEPGEECTGPCCHQDDELQAAYSIARKLVRWADSIDVVEDSDSGSDSEEYYVERADDSDIENGCYSSEEEVKPEERSSPSDDEERKPSDDEERKPYESDQRCSSAADVKTAEMKTRSRSPLSSKYRKVLGCDSKATDLGFGGIYVCNPDSKTDSKTLLGGDSEGLDCLGVPIPSLPVADAPSPRDSPYLSDSSSDSPRSPMLDVDSDSQEQEQPDIAPGFDLSDGFGCEFSFDSPVCGFSDFQLAQEKHFEHSFPLSMAVFSTS